MRGRESACVRHWESVCEEVMYDERRAMKHRVPGIVCVMTIWDGINDLRSQGE